MKMKKTSQEDASLQKAWQFSKYFLALVLVVFVIAKTNLSQISMLKENLAWIWVFFSFSSLCIMTMLKALQYQTLISRNLPFPQILRVVIWQNTISNFIASSAGIASYMTMLKADQNVKLTRSGVTFIITKVGDLLAICLYLALSAALVWAQITSLRWLTILLIFGMLFGLATFLVTILWRESFVNWIVNLLSWLKLEHFSPVEKGVEMLRSLAQEEKGPIFSMLRTGIKLSFIYMTLTMLFAIMSMKIFNLEVSYWAIIYVASLMQLISFIPVQVFGGLGVSEVTSVYLYSFFGVAAAEISAVALGLRAFFYLMNGLVFLYIPLDALIQRRTHKK